MNIMNVIPERTGIIHCHSIQKAKIIPRMKTKKKNQSF